MKTRVYTGIAKFDRYTDKEVSFEAKSLEEFYHICFTTDFGNGTPCEVKYTGCSEEMDASDEYLECMGEAE